MNCKRGGNALAQTAKTVEKGYAMKNLAIRHFLINDFIYTDKPK